MLLSAACADKNAYVWDIQAILNAAGLEALLSIPAQKSELKKKLLSGANATQHPTNQPASRRVPEGFFKNVQGRDPSSSTSRLHSDPSLRRRRLTFGLSWGSYPPALPTRLPQLFHYFQPSADEPIESQQHPGPSTSSRRSPPVVEVPALDDKKALYTARRPERASYKVKRIKNPVWWARIVLFLCCVSPSTDSVH
ncbi:hypothetical protein DFJ58DRAFT_802923 [Suillus subalutaceus]|uniref:uncharacterized protein n=1 Tax=Suillus subalutaceus TaxID=48586 RepID=UPI001B871B5D|nr:uncharacterized protein DFJ58DRAFT_802923 [Suillus subalutaceus]KAG1844343.1 hypothetical protein DFJ58DRAFT_802923 [Suillus subalutaceus]